jgi:mono/diheme cytochrome c family protein
MTEFLKRWSMAAVIITVSAGGCLAGDADKGRALYGQICSHCHGPEMVNPGTVSFDLRKFPHDDEPRFLNAVTNGRNSMPPLGAVLSREEMEDIFAYVKTGGRQP